MAIPEILVFATFVALVICTDIDSADQKKRGVSQGTNLNSISTEAQKQDYTYGIYSQNPSSQNSQSSTYQSQVPNSFYPTQESSQYYSPPNSQTGTSSYQPQHQVQVNAVSPQSSSQFIPLNFIPNSGYQTKYQIVSGKPNGSLQLAFFQPPSSYQSPPLVPYSPTFFSSNPTNHNPFINPSGNFNAPQSFQPFGGSYLNQPSAMLLFAQPNPSPYNNLLYPNPVQNLYYPSQSQSKYNGPYTSGSIEYDKLQGSQSQKDDNDIGNSSDYTAPSDSSSSYKNSYSASRNTYSKIR